MWVVIGGDGDIDYTKVYGPYATEAEANVEQAKASEYLEDEVDISYRVQEVMSGPIPPYDE